MNNSNPLIPQGSMLEQNQGRARFKLAVFCGFALHILFVGGLLMVGCKKDQGAEQAAGDQTTLTEPDTNSLTNIDANLVQNPAVSNELTTPPLPVPASNEVAQPNIPSVTPGAATEYVVTKGDSFSSISQKTGVSVKAIQNANPNVVSTKLKVGQKLQIPAPSSAAPSTPSISTHADTSSGSTYTVKSGDSLTKIASKTGVSIKALRSANNLKTDRIKVGDKLKIPAANSAAPSTPVEPAPVDSTIPATSAVPTLPPPAPGR